MKSVLQCQAQSSVRNHLNLLVFCCRKYIKQYLKCQSQIFCITDVRVKVGDHVEKGQPLVVLSAMKMEMVVQAPIAGTIKRLEISNGMKLEGEDLIVTIE